MPNNKLQALIKCPYFDHVGDKSITCEGIQNTTFRIGFRGKIEMYSWAYEHCEKFDTGNCPFAEIVSREYEEEREE